MRSLAQRLLIHIRQHELLKAGDRVGVAVSGGIDSVALLRLLLELRGELGIVLSVVHFNHKLRGAESDADEQFVAELARRHDLEFFCDSDDVAGHAREEGVSLETAARELRYGFFRSLLEVTSGANAPAQIESLSRSAESAAPPAVLNKVATAHTLDDQAETVLMRVIRGAGLRGLGGIHPRIPVEDEHGETCGEIIRPLLATRRHELEQYLKEIAQPWREDSSNSETHFTRNRVRQLVVPLLEKEFNPAITETLAELAEIARGEEDFWDNEIAGWMGTAVHWSEPEWARGRGGNGLIQISNGEDRIDKSSGLVMNATVDRVWFLGEPIAAQRRLIKAIGDEADIPLEFRHVDEILRFAASETGSRNALFLPRGWKVRREPEQLVFLTPDPSEPDTVQNYEYEFEVPGQVILRETGTILEVRRIPAAGEAGYNPDHLLDAESLPRRLRVRNWRPGDRFWPAHTKSPKKIKDLLQERHVAQPERGLWPVIVSEGEIVWMRGFPSPAKLRAKPGRDSVTITEMPLPDPAIR